MANHEGLGFRVLKCRECGEFDGIYYAPPLSEDEQLKELEIKEYESDFDVEVSRTDGKFISKCECGGRMEEVDIEEWPISMLKEVIGNIMEDDNHHSITSIGNTFDRCMGEAGIEEEQRSKTLINYINMYLETGRVAGYS